MLILFDIDGTILLTRGAGILAMQDAGQALFSPEFTIEGVDFAGRLDPLIFASLCERNGVEPTEANHDQFRAKYHHFLEHRLTTSATAEILPGVKEIVERLHAMEDVTLGLVTGNYPHTGRLKLRAAGLDPEMFVIQAWADMGEHRRDLPAAALKMYEQMMGRAIDPSNAVIIGDTPHDVDCAKFNGCRVLAVGTNPKQPLEELLEHGADRAVQDMSDVDDVIDWLLGGVTDPRMSTPG
jgi:phosphoglycolate phosphatase